MLPNTPPDIPTPALVIDEPTARRNLTRLAQYAKGKGLGVRPHTKTHKSLLMAREQLKAGAVGLTVAKVGEAEVMAKVGEDLLLAYPALDPARTGRIAALARDKTIRVAVDSAFAADALADAARRAGATIGILVDIDVGFHRTGMQTPAQALALAQHVSKTKSLRLDGLFFYPGHIVAKPDEQTAILAPIEAMLEETITLWKKNGLEAKIVSGGSTPTGTQSHHLKALTEIRPGTYIYYDRNCITGNWCAIDDVAAVIVCTVISDAVPGKCVLDAGTKTFTSDRLVGDATNQHGSGLIIEYPQAKIVRCSEEHAEVDLSLCDRRPKLGDRVRVIPNHICPCVNLQDQMYLRHEDGTIETLPIEGRGKLS
ncbi:MAG: alanine racemase [Planctomycetes bacterium]|nr:alanine racemase [Planctomycetota bacterium]